MAKPLKRVLIVEDDDRLAHMLGLHVSKIGCEVDYAYDGEEGLHKARSEEYELVILDRTLPKLEGLEVCRRLREDNIDVKVLILTALSDELDLVTGFETGADDYVGKPFALAELMARVKALLRRTANQADKSSKATRVFGSLKIEVTKRRTYIASEEVSLTPREFDLLVYLSEEPGRVFSREEILREVWGSTVNTYDQSINTIVKRLRRKLEINSSIPSIIETIRGVGYRFADN